MKILVAASRLTLTLTGHRARDMPCCNSKPHEGRGQTRQTVPQTSPPEPSQPSSTKHVMEFISKTPPRTRVTKGPIPGPGPLCYRLCDSVGLECSSGRDA